MTITSPNLSWTLTPSGGVMDSRGVSESIDPNAKYVSLTGNDSNTGSAISPWRNPGVAASRLTEGQTLYVRAGLYDIATPTASRSCAISPGANNCLISAYPGESVTLRGGVNGANFGVFPCGGVLGTGPKSGVIFDGFTVIGMCLLDGCPAGSRPSQYINCDMSVGGDPWEGILQGGVLWMENCVNTKVTNCYIHDNGPLGRAGLDGLLMGYVIKDALFERCTIRGSFGAGFLLKDDLEHVTVKQCWFDDMIASGLWTGNNPANPYDWSLEVTQCLFTNCNTASGMEYGGVAFLTNNSQSYVYNNVFHNCKGGDLTQWSNNGVPHQFFNNICHQSIDKYINFVYNITPSCNYLDYNDYYGAASPKWEAAGSVATTLANWRTLIRSYPALAAAEAASSTNNPLFLNAATGTFSHPDDFKRSSYPADGRGGSWPSVRGMYITGNEVIGCRL